MLLLLYRCIVLFFDRLSYFFLSFQQLNLFSFDILTCLFLYSYCPPVLFLTFMLIFFLFFVKMLMFNDVEVKFMPNMKNAKKRVKVIKKQTVTKNDYEASMKTAMKKVEKAVAAKDKALAESELKVAIKRIDKATKANVAKKNMSARSKSRLSKKVN